MLQKPCHACRKGCRGGHGTAPWGAAEGWEINLTGNTVCDHMQSFPIFPISLLHEERRHQELQKMPRHCLKCSYTMGREEVLYRELLLTWDLFFIKSRWYLGKLLLRNSRCYSAYSDPTQSKSAVRKDKGVFIGTTAAWTSEIEICLQVLKMHNRCLLQKQQRKIVFYNGWREMEMASC